MLKFQCRYQKIWFSNAVLHYDCDVSNWVFLDKNKIQTVLTGKHASKYPFKTVSKPLLDFSRNQIFDGSVKIFDNFFLLSYTALRFSMQTFLGKNQPNVRKKFDFVKRVKPTWNALTGCLELAKLQFRDQKNDFQDLTRSLMWSSEMRFFRKKNLFN